MFSLVVTSSAVVLGIRLPKGFEFGLGPNVMIKADKDRPVHSSLLIAIGKSIDFKGVSIPLNLAVSTNSDGTKLSFIFGYALRS